MGKVTTAFNLFVAVLIDYLLERTNLMGSLADIKSLAISAKADIDAIKTTQTSDSAEITRISTLVADLHAGQADQAEIDATQVAVEDLVTAAQGVKGTATTNNTTLKSIT